MECDGKQLKGLVAATFTPMTLASDINLPVIQQYVDYLINKQNVRNIFVNGTTGEGMSLSVQERKQLTEEWVKHSRGKMDQVMVHVGCLSLTDSKDLAAHASSCGANAISAVCPSFIKPASTVQVQDLLNKVRQEKIPSFRGVKFSDINLLDFGRCIHEYKEFEFLYGVDEQLLGALAFGAKGAVGSTYNYLGKTTNKMLEAFEEGNLRKAQEIQASTQEFITFIFANGWGLAEFKDIMTLVSGIQLGPARLPLLSALESNHLTKIKSEMDRMGLN